MQVSAVLARVVLDVAGRVGDPAARVVHPVGADGVPPREVAVHPRAAGDGDDDEGAGGERGRGEHEERDGDGHPDGAGEQRDGPQEDERDDGAGEREPGQEQEDGAGDGEREEADHLGGVWRVRLHPPEQRRRRIRRRGRVPMALRRRPALSVGLLLPICHARGRRGGVRGSELGTDRPRRMAARDGEVAGSEELRCGEEGARAGTCRGDSHACATCVGATTEPDKRTVVLRGTCAKYGITEMSPTRAGSQASTGHPSDNEIDRAS